MTKVVKNILTSPQNNINYYCEELMALGEEDNFPVGWGDLTSFKTKLSYGIQYRLYRNTEHTHFIICITKFEHNYEYKFTKSKYINPSTAEFTYNWECVVIAPLIISEEHTTSICYSTKDIIDILRDTYLEITFIPEQPILFKEINDLTESIVRSFESIKKYKHAIKKCYKRLTVLKQLTKIKR